MDVKDKFAIHEAYENEFLSGGVVEMIVMQQYSHDMAPSDLRASEAHQDLVKQPLLSDKNQKHNAFGSLVESGSQNASDCESNDKRVDHDEWVSTCYDISLVTSWRTFAMTQGAVFDNPTKWRCMSYTVR